MFTYKIHFTRYKNGELRLSTPQWFQAESFFDVTMTAVHMVSAMAGADPDAKFDIHSIETSSHIKIVCDGSRMFETAEELTQRVGNAEGQPK